MECGDSSAVVQEESFPKGFEEDLLEEVTPRTHNPAGKSNSTREKETTKMTSFEASETDVTKCCEIRRNLKQIWGCVRCYGQACFTNACRISVVNNIVYCDDIKLIVCNTTIRNRNSKTYIFYGGKDNQSYKNEYKRIKYMDFCVPNVCRAKQKWYCRGDKYWPLKNTILFCGRFNGKKIRNVKRGSSSKMTHSSFQMKKAKGHRLFNCSTHHGPISTATTPRLNHETGRGVMRSLPRGSVDVEMLKPTPPEIAKENMRSKLFVFCFLRSNETFIKKESRKCLNKEGVASANEMASNPITASSYEQSLLAQSGLLTESQKLRKAFTTAIPHNVTSLPFNKKRRFVDSSNSRHNNQKSILTSELKNTKFVLNGPKGIVGKEIIKKVKGRKASSNHPHILNCMNKKSNVDTNKQTRIFLKRETPSINHSYEPFGEPSIASHNQNTSDASSESLQETLDEWGRVIEHRNAGLVDHEMPRAHHLKTLAENSTSYRGVINEVGVNDTVVAGGGIDGREDEREDSLKKEMKGDELDKSGYIEADGKLVGYVTKVGSLKNEQNVNVSVGDITSDTNDIKQESHFDKGSLDDDEDDEDGDFIDVADDDSVDARQYGHKHGVKDYYYSDKVLAKITALINHQRQGENTVRLRRSDDVDDEENVENDDEDDKGGYENDKNDDENDEDDDESDEDDKDDDEDDKDEDEDDKYGKKEERRKKDAIKSESLEMEMKNKNEKIKINEKKGKYKKGGEDHRINGNVTSDYVHKSNDGDEMDRIDNNEDVKNNYKKTESEYFFMPKNQRGNSSSDMGGCGEGSEGCINFSVGSKTYGAGGVTVIAVERVRNKNLDKKSRRMMNSDRDNTSLQRGFVLGGMSEYDENGSASSNGVKRDSVEKGSCNYATKGTSHFEMIKKLINKTNKNIFTISKNNKNRYENKMSIKNHNNKAKIIRFLQASPTGKKVNRRHILASSSCLHRSCMNGGVCKQVSTSNLHAVDELFEETGIDSSTSSATRNRVHVCVCREGFQGSFCHLETPCNTRDKKCYNDGECLRVADPLQLHFNSSKDSGGRDERRGWQGTVFKCQCLKGYSGSKCENFNPCLLAHTCNHNGECQVRRWCAYY